MEYLDVKTIYTILHILGAVVGAGAAFMSHAMFFISFKDRLITSNELRFLKLGSSVTWIGLLLLFFSGILLFSLDPVSYIISSKFLVKMSIVVVLIVNGILFHYKHVPLLKKHRDSYLLSSEEFVKESKMLVASGAVSLTSWLLTIVLGVMRGIPYSYAVGMGIYVVLLVVGITGALLFRKWVLMKPAKNE